MSHLRLVVGIPSEEYLQPLGITAAALAPALCVCAPTVSDIVPERRNISADVALRLAAALGTTAQFWLDLQATYDLRTAELASGEQICKEVQRLQHCA